MSLMQPAIEIVLEHEGGFVDNPNDKGGATNMGIEQHDLPDVPIKDLTKNQAVSYYAQNFWKPWMAEIDSQDICNKIFDFCVVLGISTAVRLLQRALGFPPPMQDGEFGPHTLAATNTYDTVLASYKRVLAAHFNWIVQTDSTQKPFLQGWLNRVNS